MVYAVSVKRMVSVKVSALLSGLKLKELLCAETCRTIWSRYCRYFYSTSVRYTLSILVDDLCRLLSTINTQYLSRLCLSSNREGRVGLLHFSDIFFPKSWQVLSGDKLTSCFLEAYDIFEFTSGLHLGS